MNSIAAIVFDFDGVLTDDRVWVDQDGREMVCCSRRDGLVFDILRQSGLKLLNLSTETNPVVLQREAKIKVPTVKRCGPRARRSVRCRQSLSSVSCNAHGLIPGPLTVKLCARRGIQA